MIYLTDTEIDDICHPLTQGAAQVRYLRQLGLHVERKYDGRPIVSRANFEALLSGDRRTATTGPNWSIIAT